MTLVLILSENGGMTFNKRRQSRDREIIRDLTELFSGKKIYITSFSEKLFSELDNIYVTDEPNSLSEDDVFFCENILPSSLLSVKKMVIYNFCEVYPTDLYCDLSPSSIGLSLKDKKEFVGYSHKKITREIWE